MIGDPPNIIIGSRAGLTFNDLLVHMTPIVVIELIVFTAVLPWLFRGSFTANPDKVAGVMELNEREAISDTGLLIKCGVVLVGAFTAFVGHSVFTPAAAGQPTHVDGCGSGPDVDAVDDQSGRRVARCGPLNAHVLGNRTSRT